MSGDRRQQDRRVGEKDRRKGDRRDKSDKKVLTITLTTFVTVVIVVIILFITTLAFAAVYFENKLNSMENENNNGPQIDDSEPTEYIDISNILPEPSSDDENIDDNVFEDTPNDDTSEDVPTE